MDVSVESKDACSQFDPDERVDEDNTGEEILQERGSLIEDIAKYFNSSELSDVTLIVGKERYFAHKFILAKSSTVFCTMLYDMKWKQASLTEIKLNESPECEAAFYPFLYFFYTGKISMTEDIAIGVLCLADKYNVVSLRKLCLSYMMEHAMSPNVENALQWYAWSKALNLTDLFQQCSRTIVWNVQAIIYSDHWLQLDLDFLKDLLASSDLIVPNEYDLYLAVSRWLLDGKHSDEIDKNTDTLLPLVRFPQMLVKQLYKVETSELASHEKCGSMVLQLVGKAYRFRSLCPPASGLDERFDQTFFHPRDYSDLEVHAVSLQNTLRFGIQVDAKMYVGPVPNHEKSGEWKITYRKNGELWQLQVYCHETAMINQEAKFQLVILIYDDMKRVIQVSKEPVFLCTRGNPLNCQLSVTNPEQSSRMAVLIKPIP